MTSDSTAGRFTRRDFARKVGALGAALAAGSSAAPALASESLAQASAAAEPGPQPAGTPALWRVRLAPNGRHIELDYRGKTWLSQLRVRLKASGMVYDSDAPGTKLQLVPPAMGGETVVKAPGNHGFEILFSPQNSRLMVSVQNVQGAAVEGAEIEAAIEAGSDPIQARLAEAHDDVQQMVSGLAASSLNDCVFDRFRDQALRVNARYTDFTPAASGFQVTAGTSGAATPVCSFEVLERVYESRLRYYTPFDKEKWPEPPIGWCSFHYYGNVLGEDDILRNAEALARDYEAFGLRYILIDGGWQAHGISGNWTKSNSDFPHGMKWLAGKIRALGLKPALWLSEFGTDDENIYSAHKSWFLHDARGNAKLGTWFGTYIADFSNPAMKRYLYNVYREITGDWGYDYFKLDGENATRDIWAQNRVRAYNPALDADTAFRQALGLIRQAMSSRPGVFFSACGPEYPTESIGIVQSARLGGDILSFSSADPSSRHSELPSFRCVRTALEGMRRGYYTHNIAWYADPDGVLARPPLTEDQVRTWFSVVGLTGQLLMLGDDMAALPAERREITRKIMPVADIKPMELYPRSASPHIWILHVGRSFGTWAVAGLFNWDYDAREVPFTDAGASPFFTVLSQNDRLRSIHRSAPASWAMAEDAQKALAENRRLEALATKPAGLELLPVPAYLSPPPPRRIVLNFANAGLKGNGEYLLFDFWMQEFLGTKKGEYTVSLPPHSCQVLSLRPATGHPQLVGTDRHVTMGGVEVADERWDQAREQLTLALELVRNYPAKFTIYKAGSRFVKATAADARMEVTENGSTVQVALLKPASGRVEVTLQFAAAPH
ncbi:MAG: alpha-galactosidase [Terriglobia bacterium]